MPQKIPDNRWNNLRGDVMKLLYILRSVFRDWFTKDIKYTLLMIITMFLSVLALYISTFVIGSDVFPSIETEKRRERTYVLDTGTWHPLSAEQLSYIIGGESSEDDPFPKLSIDDYIGTEQIYCQFIIDKVNGEDISNEKIESAYPLFSNEYSNVREFIEVSMGYSHDDILKKYPEILTGNYIIVPNNSLYKNGDVISCLNTELIVIGRCEYDSYIVPFSFFENYLNDCGYTAQGLFMTSYIYENKLSGKWIENISKVLYPEGNIYLHDIGPSSVDIALFIMAELVICGITAVFCVCSMLSVINALIEKTSPMLDIFRVLGAKRRTVIFLVYFQLAACFVISFVIALILLPYISYAMSRINVMCEIRTKYTIIVFAISMASIMLGSRKIIVRTARKKLV